MPTAPHAWVAAAVLAGTAYLALLALGRRGLLKLAPALCCAAALVSVGWIPAAAMLLWAAGDWALLSERRFVAGLLAFLVGHLLFLAALWPIPLASVHPAALATIIAAVVAMLALLLPRVRGVLRAAVPLYAVALGAMALAMSTLGALGTLGGLAFVISDAVLALDKFRGPVRGAVYVVMTTYYAALALLTEAILQRA